MGLKVSFCDFIRHYVLLYAAYSYVQQNAFEYASELSISSLHCRMDKVILNEQEQDMLRGFISPSASRCQKFEENNSTVKC